MIRRIVKLTLLAGKKDEFIRLFSEASPSIRKCKGCLKVELLADVRHPEIVFTFSEWETEEDLENYRKSSLFEGTWKRAKTLFSAKAEAWSLQIVN